MNETWNLTPQEIEIRARTCQTCGMLLDDAGEFHPYVFCVLKKAGLDPWRGIASVVTSLGIDTTHWPKRPPLIRTLKHNDNITGRA